MALEPAYPRARVPLQETRFAQHLAKSITARIRHPHVRAIYREVEQQLLFIASRADLAQAERATIAVGEEWVFDAALRKKLVLRADDEQVLERAAAELHHVAEEDGAGRFRDERALFQRVDHR